MSGPDPGAFGSVDPGSVPAVSAFQGADPAFAAGPPLDCSSERRPVPRRVEWLRVCPCEDRHVTDAEVVQIVLDAFLALRHRTWQSASDPCRGVSVPDHAAVQQEAEAVVGEVAEFESD